MATLTWLPIRPEQLGQTIRDVAACVVERGERLRPQAALYAEKVGAFQCSTCRYVRAVNATHGHCAVVEGSVRLDEGCCVLWDADPAQLQLWREK